MLCLIYTLYQSIQKCIHPLQSIYVPRNTTSDQSILQQDLFQIINVSSLFQNLDYSEKAAIGLLKYCFGPKNLAKADQFNGWIRSAYWKSSFGSTKHPPGLNCKTALASLKGFYFSDSVLTLVGFNFQQESCHPIVCTGRTGRCSQHEEKSANSIHTRSHQLHNGIAMYFG